MCLNRPIHRLSSFIDSIDYLVYNTPNYIGQFVTILSVNKTRETKMGAMRSFLLGAVTFCAHFFVFRSVPP